MKTFDEIGIVVTKIVLIGFVVLFGFLGYLEVRAEMKGSAAGNTSCGTSEMQVVGYCQ